MADIVTLTVNPAIDLSTFVDRVKPGRKLRCHTLRRDPGGGGINVARVIRRLGAEVTAIYTAGGFTGQLLEALIEREGIDGIALKISVETREDFTVHEEASQREYRFVLEGPRVEEAEWQASLDRIGALNPFPNFLVASGSLPPGVPDDYYRRLARLAHERKAKLFVDTSGPALKEALSEGIYLTKPNLNELSALAGISREREADFVPACRRLIEDGKAEIVALTLGERGALLVTRDQALRAPPLPITPASTVGAGDSFLGGMIWSLASGAPLETAFRTAMAAGAAALLSPGTALAHPDDVKRLLEKVTLE